MKLLPRTTTIDSDDTLGRGMDLALVVAVFFGVGYGLDRWLGTRPVFMIAMVVVAIVGQFVAMWYRYDAAMRAHEDARAQAASSRSRHPEVPAP